ncbi:MAG: hypothetical protein CL807_10245 [Citromicrobium sp.]|nr:hypothetical protein [Citromicrobium sp.]MAO95551.1 hypothetical protein [Citromicrobium sp.]MBD77235.1 hypothetical protein [Citromicrobium sp.]MBT47491.1 hypothetical protein [Citromicrobium sp.]
MWRNIDSFASAKRTFSVAIFATREFLPILADDIAIISMFTVLQRTMNWPSQADDKPPVNP